MSLPPPSALLRHRPPALLIDAVESFGGDTLGCSATERAAWTWPVLLEGAAQTAGLLAGLQPGGPSSAAVIAEYRGVVVHAARHDGSVRFVARLDRRLLHFWRCHVEAHAADGGLLLEGQVTLAPRTRE